MFLVWYKWIGRLQKVTGKLQEASLEQKQKTTNTNTQKNQMMHKIGDNRVQLYTYNMNILYINVYMLTITPIKM